MESRRHPVIAGVCDFYIVGMVYGALAGMAGSILNVTIPVWISLVFLAVNILLVLIYHRIIAAKVSFLSPGEKIAGKEAGGGEKIWTNPYGISRWILFAVIIIDLMIFSNTWDGLSMQVYTFPQIGFKIVGLVLLTIGLMKLGRGKPIGAIFPIIGFSGVFAQLTITKSPFRSAAGMFLVLAILNLLVLIYYHARRRRFSEMGVSS